MIDVHVSALLGCVYSVVFFMSCHCFAGVCVCVCLCLDVLSFHWMARVCSLVVCACFILSLFLRPWSAFISHYCSFLPTWLDKNGVGINLWTHKFLVSIAWVMFVYNYRLSLHYYTKMLFELFVSEIPERFITFATVVAEWFTSVISTFWSHYKACNVTCQKSGFLFNTFKWDCLFSLEFKSAPIHFLFICTLLQCVSRIYRHLSKCKMFLLQLVLYIFMETLSQA